MNEFVESAMNFINENTTLLIIICVFLIFVLVLYLIDNSIKTKKLEKKQLEIDATNLGDGKEETVEPVKEEIKVPEVNEVPVPDFTETTPEAETETIVESTITVEPEINESLSKEFDNNEEIVEVESSETRIEEPIVPVQEEQTFEPTPIEESVVENIETPDIEAQTIESEVEVPEVTPVETSVPEEKSKYTNDKTITDIFSKKKVEEPSSNTIDESELDRILKEIENINNDYSNDSTIDETQDYSNMF